MLEDHRKGIANTHVLAVAYSADGKRLVSMATSPKFQYEATVRDDGKVVGTLAGNDKGMTHVMALSPDGKRLAAAFGLAEDNTGKVDVWDPIAGRIERTLEGKAGVSALAFSRDSKRLAMAHLAVADNADKPEAGVNVVEATGGKMMARLAAGADQIVALAFAPDGGRLLSAGMRRVKVWEIESGKLVNDFALSGRVLKAAFSPDGTRLVTGSDDGRFTLWHVATGQQILSLSGFSAQVLSVAFSPDGRLLAAGGIDGQEGLVKIWDGTPKVP